MRLADLAGLCFAMVMVAAAPAVGRPAAAPPSPAFHDCAGCPDMVRLPAGSFLLGSPDDEPGRYPNEGPQRRIDIRALAVGRFDVTRGQWKAFAAATKRVTQGGCAWAGASGPYPDPAASWESLGFEQDDRHPVVCVTWRDAQDYVAWLSARTHHRYRLLSEAEWD
jgi:formylglycine-generating enzyme required for sulfatase activity